ncbi:exodeoxyribonuclease VII large subunit [Xylophilus rhododendri]|uniref:Exodeoxyribonuclease 7 large subunit n=1 Tax=Xylophilus rhododendri TaxID=2697032 RepID=A0A857J315_9BURK|nr:exodeoxyribonuclease VII large subunit [Xylophilus rhododendri]QHI97255.1 exodeoxyribonuclease VII large subunit [Xylophilus rhododendri]
MNFSAASPSLPASRVWAVGALCRAIADALDARFNPVSVRGEISGFSRAASGHCYFSLKDASGQIRCAMFRRAAQMLDFAPRDGELVEVRGRLGVYEARGDLQLIAESMSRVGQGGLFEQFLQRKARLESEGLFDADRKRPLPAMPRRIGVVTSLGAAALHDVLTALARRAPHVAVLVAPASVQGAAAPGELIAALSALNERAEPPELILLVRGGGSIEDLWAFNDEALARAIAASPVPVVSGVGHETDFTIADFVADLRAPTPTAAAELAAPQLSMLSRTLDLAGEALEAAVMRRLDRHGQRLDNVAARLSRPSAIVATQRLRLERQGQSLLHALQSQAGIARRRCEAVEQALPLAVRGGLERHRQRLDRAALRLQMLDPGIVLQRGYAFLEDEAGATVQQAAQTRPGQRLRATLSDGTVALTVDGPPADKV